MVPSVTVAADVALIDPAGLASRRPTMGAGTLAHRTLSGVWFWVAAKAEAPGVRTAFGVATVGARAVPGLGTAAGVAGAAGATVALQMVPRITTGALLPTIGGTAGARCCFSVRALADILDAFVATPLVASITANADVGFRHAAMTRGEWCSICTGAPVSKTA